MIDNKRREFERVFDMNLVWEGGQTHAFLYQGGAMPGGIWPDNIDVIVQMNKEENWRSRIPSNKYYSAWQIPDDELDADQYELVRSLASHVHSFLREGKNVLVHCSAGLNRSGVVVARALMYMGYSPDAAIGLVQTARGMGALGNPYFRAWLQREGPSLAHDLAKKEAAPVGSSR